MRNSTGQWCFLSNSVGVRQYAVMQYFDHLTWWQIA